MVKNSVAVLMTPITFTVVKASDRTNTCRVVLVVNAMITVIIVDLTLNIIQL